MEPTTERPDDWELNCTDYTFYAEPQWSRPILGRMMSGAMNPQQSLPSPQWSRPFLGRMIATAILFANFIGLPQWSRPILGRTTQRHDDDEAGVQVAAMEPTEETAGWPT
jgi:hypothetical protein